MINQSYLFLDLEELLTEMEETIEKPIGEEDMKRGKEEA
jgi:hypothetical protein